MGYVGVYRGISRNYGEFNSVDKKMGNKMDAVMISGFRCQEPPSTLNWGLTPSTMVVKGQGRKNSL